MAEQWWTTADGARDAGWRDRTRLMQGAAAQTLSGADFLDVKGQSAAPIEALVSSGTLRDLGIDRVTFRHDVLREWAIASTLHAGPELVDRLHLDRPSTAMFARGVELAARMAIERATDGVKWHALVDRLSQAGVHRSWRRAALLALARSEAAEAPLQRASPELLANGAALPPQNEGAIGVVISSTEIVFPPLWKRQLMGAYYGIKDAWYWGMIMIQGFIKIFSDLFGGVVPKDVAGPVGIFALTSEAAKYGIIALLNFVGIVSVNLAILNVIPFPALDGGRLLFIGIESLFGRKVVPKVESTIHMIGMVILLILIVAITAHDIQRLIVNGGVTGYIESVFK